MTSTRAEDLKAQGNICFQAGDYAGAEKSYTQAIIKDSTNAAFFTNRAMARMKMEMYEEVINDCLKAIELLPTSLKAYTYLGQAQLKLSHPNEALTSSLHAYELALSQRSPSLQTIASTILSAKKEKWEKSEKRRIEKASLLLKETKRLFYAEAARQVDRVRMDKGGGVAAEEEIEAVWAEAEGNVKGVEETWAKAEMELGVREVPEWLVDHITFGIMIDPVVTVHGHSYDRATLLNYLKRSKTDPLTREPLREEDLRPNLALKAACEAFLKDNGWAADW